MDTFTAFRTSVIAAPVIALLAFAYTSLATPTFSQDWQDVLAWSDNGGFLTEEREPKIGLLAAVIAFSISAIGNQIALFFYWPPSRLIFLILTVLGFISTPFLGLTVSPPLATLGNDLSVFISGVTLALAYSSPVAERFNRNMQNKPLHLPTGKV